MDTKSNPVTGDVSGAKASNVGSDKRLGDDHAEAAKEQLKDEIRATRGEMNRTVEQIERQLKPERLKNEALEQFGELKEKIKSELREEFSHAKDQVRDEFQRAKSAVRDATVGRVEDMAHDARTAVSEAGTGIVETIKANPIPAALAGVGLAWLIFNGRRTSENGGHRRRDGWRAPRYRYSDSFYQDGETNRNGVTQELDHGVETMGNALHRAQEKAGNMAGQVQQRAGELAHRVGDKAGRWADETEQRLGQMTDEAARELRRVEDYAQRTWRENPLAVGAVVIGLGAVAGLAIPRSRVEDELLGPVRDDLLDKATDLAHEAVGKAEQAAKQMTDKIEG